MSYIYTVKPLKESIKIAAESDDLQVNDFDRTISIHCIGLSNWPAGEKVEREERPEGAIRTGSGWWVPLRYCNETEKAPAVPEHDQPEFIVNLYKAASARCDGIKCADCPMSLIPDCSSFTNFISHKWGIIE